MSLNTLVREIEYTFITASPLHIGGERGIHPSLVDLKVERRTEVSNGEIRETVVVPGSTIKGVMRHVFEDMLKLKVLEKLSKPPNRRSDQLTSLYKIVANALASVVEGLGRLPSFRGQGGAIELLIRLLSREQQFLSEDAMALLLRKGYSITSCADQIGKELGNSLSGVSTDDLQRLANMACTTLPSLYPLVCDPTSPNTSCIPDISIIDAARDRNVAARLLLNIALARKAPLTIEVCPVCILFGAPGRASPLRILDAEPANLDLKVLPLQTRVSIDRYTFAAKRGKLYTLEYVPAGITFKGKILVVNPLLHPIYEDSINDLLMFLLKMAGNRMIGGLKSTGMGLVDVREGPRTNNPVDKLFMKYVELLKEAYKDQHLQQVKNMIREKLLAHGLDGEEVKNMINAIDSALKSYKNIIEIIQGG